MLNKRCFHNKNDILYLIEFVVNKVREKIKMEVTLRVYEVVERQVKIMGNSGEIYVPNPWLGKK